MSSNLSERTLQLSLISFKERVVNQQKRIEDLEEENDRLRHLVVVARSGESSSGCGGGGQTNHGSGGEGQECAEIIRQLEEANLHLRQRNLELTQALLNKNLSLNSIRSFASGDGCMDAMESLASVDEEEEDDADDVIDDDVTDDSDRKELQHQKQTPSQIDKLQEQSMNKIADVKNVLLEQQRSLVSLLRKQREQTAAAAAEKAAAAAKEAAAAAAAAVRCCPMCEVPFPEKQVSVEEFEAHVLEHFSYEDRQQSSLETIKNYDILLDAQTSFDGDFG